MKNPEQVASVRETYPLAELEATIARGKEWFVGMGLALGAIRDLRLYRPEFGSFDKYCRAKWGCGRQRAYRLIKAAAAGKSNTRVTPFNQAAEERTQVN
jgi:hypothetical protein